MTDPKVTEEMIEAGARALGSAGSRGLMTWDEWADITVADIFIAMKAKEPKPDPTQLQEAMLDMGDTE